MWPTAQRRSRKTPIMSYYISLIEEDQCVFLNYEGEMPAADAEYAQQEVNELLGEKRWNRLVVDATELHSASTTLELFDFAENLCLGLPRGVWIALVFRPDQVKYAQLVENIARNRGVILKCFADVDNANNWVQVAPATLHTCPIKPFHEYYYRL
jgi:hypothetical protein